MVIIPSQTNQQIWIVSDAPAALVSAALDAYARAAERLMEKKVAKPAVDLHIIGGVYSVDEAMYSYGDVMDEHYCSMLARPLLQFEGKIVEVTVKVLDEEEA